MKQSMHWILLAVLIGLVSNVEVSVLADESRTTNETITPSETTHEVVHVTPQARTSDEARGRARLLHELIHGALQVMHRDFFDEDDAAAIPSSSLEDVFEEMQQSHQVKIRWLVVDTDIVNVDHEPEDNFEKAAVKALKTGRKRYESIEQGRYRYAGAIRLASQCLKCHVKNRTETKDRVAGLSIAMPLKPPSPKVSTP